MKILQVVVKTIDIKTYRLYRFSNSVKIVVELQFFIVYKWQKCLWTVCQEDK